MRRCRRWGLYVWALGAMAAPGLAQVADGPVRVFGYFQNAFNHQTENEVVKESAQPDQNSFSVQQLNLFVQKDLATNWTGLINIEMLNSYSSSRRWGALNLEEAWARYRFSQRLNVKMGLHIPPFNNLNEIKNRTPLLPYVIRPLVYESSFNEFIPTEEFWPARAFGQVYGQLPAGRSRLDYALYIGNSPNINSHADNERLRRGQQTGVDTTQRVMLGGRVGLRYGEVRGAISGTYDHVNFAINESEDVAAGPNLKDTLAVLGVTRFDAELVPRVRFGADFSLHYRHFSFESEFNLVRYRDDTPGFDFNKTFYYATLGCFFTDELFGFVSFWDTDMNSLPFKESHVRVPNVGLAYNLHDAVYLKAHYGYVNIEEEEKQVRERDFSVHFISLAASVFF